MKRPNGPKLEPEHKLRVNFKFSHPQSRIHVPMLKLAKQQKQENMETQSQITVQRKHQVDAAIVRVIQRQDILAFVLYSRSFFVVYDQYDRNMENVINNR